MDNSNPNPCARYEYKPNELQKDGRDFHDNRKRTHLDGNEGNRGTTNENEHTLISARPVAAVQSDEWRGWKGVGVICSRRAGRVPVSPASQGFKLIWNTGGGRVSGSVVMHGLEELRFEYGNCVVWNTVKRRGSESFTWSLLTGISDLSAPFYFWEILWSSTEDIGGSEVGIGAWEHETVAGGKIFWN